MAEVESRRGPEHQIRQSLERLGGSHATTFGALLSRWRLKRPSETAVRAVTDALLDVGIDCSPELSPGLDFDERIQLTISREIRPEPKRERERSRERREPWRERSGRPTGTAAASDPDREQRPVGSGRQRPPRPKPASSGFAAAIGTDRGMDLPRVAMLIASVLLLGSTFLPWFGLDDGASLASSPSSAWEWFSTLDLVILLAALAGLISALDRSDTPPAIGALALVLTLGTLIGILFSIASPPDPESFSGAASTSAKAGPWFAAFACAALAYAHFDTLIENVSAMRDERREEPADGVPDQ